MGQGVGRVWRPPAPRVEQTSTRGPSPTSFWRFGLDKGTSIVFGQATRAAGAAAARVVEVVSAVRATHPVLYLTHARAFVTYRCGVDGGARGRRAAGAAERERGRGRRRGRGDGGRRERLAAARGGGRQLDRRHQEEEAEKKGEGRTVSSTTARCRRTGLGTRGMRIRHRSYGSVSQGTIARGLSDHEHLGRGAYVSPLSLPQSPHLMPDATVDLEPISSSA
jgi:hypothetical protein